MNKKEKIKTILERRKENEGDGEIICSKEINENLKRIFNGQPLTRPLRVLKNNCEFMKKYNVAFEIIESDKIDKERGSI